MRPTISSIFSSRDLAAFQRLFEMLCAVKPGQFDVQAGIKGERRRLGFVAGDRVMDMEQANTPIVGDNQTIKAPLVAGESSAGSATNDTARCRCRDRQA